MREEAFLALMIREKQTCERKTSKKVQDEKKICWKNSNVETEKNRHYDIFRSTWEKYVYIVVVLPYCFKLQIRLALPDLTKTHLVSSIHLTLFGATFTN